LGSLGPLVLGGIASLALLINSIFHPAIEAIESATSIVPIEPIEFKGLRPTRDPTIQKYQNKIFNKSSKNHQISHFSQI
jgi:hypothetical protein